MLWPTDSNPECGNSKGGEFVRNMIIKFVITEVVLTDQGSNILNKIFQNACKFLRIKRIHTTAFHPESKGGIERAHTFLVEHFRH